MPRGAPLGAPRGFMIEKEPPRKLARRLLNSFSLTSFDTVSRGRDCARSGNFPTMGNFQVRKWSKPTGALPRKHLLALEEGAGGAFAHPEEAKMCSALQPPASLRSGTSLRSAPSRAVVPALGQEMARSMCHFQARNGQRHTVALPRKHLLAPYTGRLK